MPHLLAAITAHGYGHLAQSAPVINALRRHQPNIRLTLYTLLPRTLLAQRIEGEFTHIERAPDVGMLMHNALTVDTAASVDAYQTFHQDWARDIAREAEWLREIAPDLIFANVPYRILAAAEQAAIPAVALCSLNWSDLYRQLCGQWPEAAAIHAQMLAAYNSASLFLQPAPSMPMGGLHNLRAIGPIARLGTPRRVELAARCGAELDDCFVLVSLGGMPFHFDTTAWPQRPNLRWIVPRSGPTQRKDIVTFESLGLHFVDTLCSADALLTKPGYGSFTEAVCNGVPVLYVPRENWPEEACLVDWLQQHGRGQAVSAHALTCGELTQPLQKLFGQSAAIPPVPSGAEEAAAVLADYLLKRYARTREHRR